MSGALHDRQTLGAIVDRPLRANYAGAMRAHFLAALGVGLLLPFAALSEISSEWVALAGFAAPAAPAAAGLIFGLGFGGGFGPSHASRPSFLPSFAPG